MSRSAIDTDELTRLHALGMNDVQIATAMDRSRNTIASARTRLGLPSQDKTELARAAGRLGGKPANPERIATQQEIARQMYGEGKKNGEIADCLDIHPSRVTQILKSMGLTVQARPGRGIIVRIDAPTPPPNNGAALR
jgi:DNA-binding CsgD family transcriptional regulator